MIRQSRPRRLTVGLLFLLPNILGFLAFILVPLVMSFGMAFTDWDFLRHNIFRHEPLHFIGLGNFARLFSHPLFWQYLGNTFFLMLGLPFAIAGSLASKKRVPSGAGTLATDTPLFVVLLAATVVIVGALAFFPALALGPVVEELQFQAH